MKQNMLIVFCSLAGLCELDIQLYLTFYGNHSLRGGATGTIRTSGTVVSDMPFLKNGDELSYNAASSHNSFKTDCSL